MVKGLKEPRPATGFSTGCLQVQYPCVVLNILLAEELKSMVSRNGIVSAEV